MADSGAVEECIIDAKEVSMAGVMVYYFTQYNIVTDEKVHSSRPATLEAIGKIENAIVLEETAQEVDTSRLDGDGFYTPGTEGVV